LGILYPEGIWRSEVFGEQAVHLEEKVRKRAYTHFENK
jgi:hypothetical protein